MRPVQFDFQPPEDFVVGKCPQGRAATLEIHRVRAAPEPQVGMIGLARPVHPGTPITAIVMGYSAA